MGVPEVVPVRVVPVRLAAAEGDDNKDSSKGSNIGMDMDNSMGSMDICSNMVEDKVAGGTGY